MAKKRTARTVQKVDIPAALSTIARALDAAGKQASKLAADFDAGRAKCYRESELTAKPKKAKKR